MTGGVERSALTGIANHKASQVAGRSISTGEGMMSQTPKGAQLLEMKNQGLGNIYMQGSAAPGQSYQMAAFAHNTNLWFVLTMTCSRSCLADEQTVSSDWNKADQVEKFH